MQAAVNKRSFACRLSFNNSRSKIQGLWNVIAFKELFPLLISGGTISALCHWTVRISGCRFSSPKKFRQAKNMQICPWKRFGDSSRNNSNYYPTALSRVQITPKTSTNITRYSYSRAPVWQVFSQRASHELDWSYEKNFCLSKRISFLRFFLTEILKWKTWIDV